jgi:hypothetical protein
VQQMVVNLQFSENNVISFIKYTILVFVGKLNFLARVIVNISQVDQHLLLRDVSSCKHTQVTWKFWKYTHKKNVQLLQLSTNSAPRTPGITDNLV